MVEKIVPNKITQPILDNDLERSFTKKELAGTVRFLMDEVFEIIENPQFNKALGKDNYSADQELGGASCVSVDGSVNFTAQINPLRYITTPEERSLTLEVKEKTEKGEIYRSVNLYQLRDKTLLEVIIKEYDRLNLLINTSTAINNKKAAQEVNSIISSF